MVSFKPTMKSCPSNYKLFWFVVVKQYQQYNKCS